MKWPFVIREPAPVYDLKPLPEIKPIRHVPDIGLKAQVPSQGDPTSVKLFEDQALGVYSGDVGNVLAVLSTYDRSSVPHQSCYDLWNAFLGSPLTKDPSVNRTFLLLQMCDSEKLLCIPRYDNNGNCSKGYEVVTQIADSNPLGADYE